MVGIRRFKVCEKLKHCVGYHHCEEVSVINSLEKESLLVHSSEVWSVVSWL